MVITGQKGFATIMVMILFLLVCLSTEARSECNRMVFIRDGNVWISKVTGKMEKRLTTSGLDRNPAISADGEWIAYASNCDESTGFCHLYLGTSTGTTQKRFSMKGLHGADFPAFAPDGSTLAFVGLSGAKSHWPGEDVMLVGTVSLMAIDLLKLKSYVLVNRQDELIDGNMVLGFPAFSSDGRYIAFIDSSETAGEIEVVEANGKPFFRYPFMPGEAGPCMRPRFDRDGTHLVCYVPQPPDQGVGAIYLINLIKGTKRKVGDGINPVFTHNGRSIIFERPGGRKGKGIRSDLWSLDLNSGSVPKRIVANGEQPSTQQCGR